MNRVINIRDFSSYIDIIKEIGAVQVKKLKRNERIGALVKVLSDSPNKIFTLSYFTNLFNAAKSTVSEDLVIVKKMMDKMDLGRVVTIPGAAGGVRYEPFLSKENTEILLTDLINDIKSKERAIPGGFLYLTDVLYNPAYVYRIGSIFAEYFMENSINYVITVETKGIPIAMMTAHALNVPLVIVRNENRVTEGSTLSINYVSGTTGKLMTMYAPKRSIEKGSNVLIIDDFMKGGGTAKGLVDLVNEFDSNVKGIGVLIETMEPEEKMVSDYISLLTLDEKNYDGGIRIFPSEKYKSIKE